jgi:TolB protein
VKRALTAALLLSALLPSAARAEFPGTSLLQLSEPPARNPAISQDRRFGRIAAYEADTGGTTNVYAARRADGYGETGSPWHLGTRELVSAGLGGQPANGPSTQPSLDGTSRVAPHCVAFVSAASNLVPGDTNGRPDAFVRDLRTNVTRRVSVNSRGRQSAGSVSEVAVNGLCTRVAFVSDAGDLALRRARKPGWRTAVTRANPPGRRQVYVRAIGGSTGIDRAMKGLTFLASATDRGVPGDGDSHSIAFATNARAITFASDARNLSSRDGNGATDVYQRVMTRRYGRRIHGRRVQMLHMDTRLVSADRDGRAGAGASSAPASNVDGSVVAFSTTASDLVRTGGHAQIAMATLHGDDAPRMHLASSTRGGVPGNGSSTAPSLTAGGSWILFESDATDIGVTTARRPDVNGVRDAMLATEPSGERWLLGEAGARGATTNLMTSPHGNYVVFERGGTVYLLYVGPQ